MTVAEERALASVAEAKARRRRKSEREGHACQESVSEQQAAGVAAISGACSSARGS